MTQIMYKNVESDVICVRAFNDFHWTEDDERKREERGEIRGRRKERRLSVNGWIVLSGM